MVCGGEVLGWFWRLTACFWCLQAVVLSKHESSTMVRALVALVEYTKKLKTGDADDVATLESLAAEIGPVSELNLGECKKFVEVVAVRAGVSSRAWTASLAGHLKRLDPLFEFLVDPRCCLVKLDVTCQDETQC